MRIFRGRRVPFRFIVVFALVLVALFVPSRPISFASDCSNTSVGLTPLTDLAKGTYEGEQGGLYPNGENTIPAEHLALGLELARLVVPRAWDGSPSSDGSIVMISIGVSNTQAKFDAFAAAIESSASNRHLVLVNGAQVGRALGQWAFERPRGPWTRIDERLAESGVTADQVQVAWIMLPSGTRGPRTLAAARSEVEQLSRVVQIAKARYPNLVLAYMSSRAYGGYILEEDSEPNAYLHGYTVKWQIEAQIEGRMDLNADATSGSAVAPWIAWGPYLWADGTTPRSDGLVWLCEDFAEDGVHPGSGVEEKVSRMLLDHFSTDPTAAPWFNGDGPTSSPADSPQPSTNANPTTTGPILDAEDVLTPIDEQVSVWQLALMGLGAGIAGGALVGLWVVRRRGDRRG